MRISMIGPFGFTPKKTMRARALRLARELVRRGHDVALFMPPWHTPDQANQTWHEDGVMIRYIALNSNDGNANVGGAIGTTARLVREALAWQPDVVHCFKPKAYSGAAASWLWLSKRRRVRVVMDLDDWEGWGGWNDLEPYPKLAKHVFARQEQWGMRQCHVLTVASRTLETLALGHGISAEKIIYLPNGPGIDTPEPGTTTPSTSDQPTILLYTRFFEFDVARLVAILDGVHTQLPELRVLLVGASLQAEDGARFRHLMAQRDLLTMVEETGWLAEEALPAVLQSADVGLYLMDDTLLNRAKCPVKLADMAALGLPVVGEAVGQVPEYVIHEKTGLLQPTGAVTELVDDVVRLLRNADERAQFGAAAQAHIQSRFAWAQLAQSAEAAYQSR